MSFRILFSVAAATAFLVAGTPALAQAKKGSNKATATAPAPDSEAAGIDVLRTAQQLARYGDANKDALALIVAARMVKSVGTKTSTAKQVGGTAGAAKDKPDMLSVDVLLQRAKVAADGRPDLLALLDDVSKSGARGREGGPGRIRSVVSTRSVDSYRVVFRGGEPARVAVSGDGDSDLDLYVYDELGNLICRDDDRSDDMYCAWNPKWTGPFVVRVRNLGIHNQYTLITN